MPDLTPDQRRELGQTAEVFEMITEANPADVSALEALAEIYVKLGEREKLASVTARLVRARRNPTAATATATAPSPDRKSTRLNSSHLVISYAVFCLKKKK